MSDGCPIYSPNHLEGWLHGSGRHQITTKKNITPKLEGMHYVVPLHPIIQNEIMDEQREDEGQAADEKTLKDAQNRSKRRIPTWVTDVWKKPHLHIMKVQGFIHSNDQKDVQRITSDTNMTGVTHVIYEDCPLDLNLKQYLEEEKKQGRSLDRETILQWAGQLISAVAHLHNMGVMHRRISPVTIYIFKESDGKITLKLGNILFGRKPGPIMTTELGVPRAYAAPETLRDGKGSDTADYKFPLDVWSYGMVLYFLTHREDPYPKNKANEINFKEYLSNEENRPELGEGVDELLKEIIKVCWKAEEKDRIKPAEIIQKLTSG